MKPFLAIKQFLSKDVFGFNGSDVLDEKLPVFPEWFFTARLGQPRAINITEIRTFARSPWIQMVLNTIKKEISTIKWEVVQKDMDKAKGSETDIEKAKEFLNVINEEMESISDLGSMAVTDVGEIDAVAWVNVYSKGSYDIKDSPIIDDLGNIRGSEKRLVLKPFGQRELLQVRPADASTFLKQIDIYRRLQAYYQYSFKNPRTNPIRFEPAEVNYMLMNKKSYNIYGFSPVQSIQQVLELLIQSTRWNKDFYKNNAVPDAIMSLKGPDKKAMKKFKGEFESKVKGKPHKLLFLNVDHTFTQMTQNSRDMEWLEGQKWYHWLVFAMFGVSPVEAGFHENVSKGNTEGQERVTVKNAIKPYIKMIEDVVNNRILPEFFQQEKLDIEFKYFPKDHTLEKIEHEQSMQEIDRGALTINEFRKAKGRLPVPGGDQANIRTDNAFGGLGGNKDEDGNPKEKENPKQDKYFKQAISKYMEKVEV
jgi:HK97 family phage portal protein